MPLIEKAYAKLHGCYKALIGGYVHNAIADLTGFPPELLVLKKGHAGFIEVRGAVSVDLPCLPIGSRRLLAI